MAAIEDEVRGFPKFAWGPGAPPTEPPLHHH
jgi:hypothetical protein